jgi:hypothetical protein
MVKNNADHPVAIGNQHKPSNIENSSRIALGKLKPEIMVLTLW